jgi:hypothetical protein
MPSIQHNDRMGGILQARSRKDRCHWFLPNMATLDHEGEVVPEGDGKDPRQKDLIGEARKGTEANRKNHRER